MAIELEKIEFNDFQEPSIGAENLNQLQDNTQTALNTLDTNKQDKLTAGNNITIENGIISVDGISETNEVYSTEETVIGTWLGKTLYRKVLNLNGLPTRNTAKNIDTGVNNIERVIKNYGYGYNPTSSRYTTLPIITSSTQYAGLTTNYNGSTNQVTIYSENDNSSYTEAYLVIEYTKTTD